MCCCGRPRNMEASLQQPGNPLLLLLQHGRRIDRRNGPEYYEAQKEVYKNFISGNEFLTIPHVLEAVCYRMISTEVKTRRLNDVSREVMEREMYSFSIVPNILARRSNATWGILLGISKEAKVLAGCTITTKSVRLQMECLGTRKTKIKLHECHWI